MTQSIQGCSLFAEARKRYHAALLNSVLKVDKNGIPSNADKDSRTSVRVAQGIAEQLQSDTGTRLAGQTSGKEFETCNADFLRETFNKLGHIRPGEWNVIQIANRNRLAIAKYEQYAHLIELDKLTKANRGLAAIIGSDYTIAPDIIIARQLLDDDKINEPSLIVDDTVTRHAALRAKNGGKPLLHASISAKWTIRSDRSQNSRSEALNLIRNRKGHLTHIVVVTGEPLPSRLASIALGTGDIDCVYHFALYELIEAVKATGQDEAIAILDTMVKGKRLKDISDLPLDLAI